MPTHEDSSRVIWGSVSCPTELADAEWKSVDQRHFDLTEIKEKESGRDQKPTSLFRCTLSFLFYVHGIAITVEPTNYSVTVRNTIVDSVLYFSKFRYVLRL